MNGMLRSPIREIINYRPPAASPASNACVPPPAGDYIISTYHTHPNRPSVVRRDGQRSLAVVDLLHSPSPAKACQ